jgi:hypothetical protein
MPAKGEVSSVDASSMSLCRLLSWVLADVDEPVFVLPVTASV